MYNCCTFFFFFFNDTATTEIYTLSLHDALPIYQPHHLRRTEDARVRQREPRSQNHRADVLGGRRLEQIGAAPRAVAHVVAHQVRDHGGVARIEIGRGHVWTSVT